jgi:hypothetical protein
MMGFIQDDQVLRFCGFHHLTLLIGPPNQMAGSDDDRLFVPTVS